ncbi:MAG: hypothetical protein IJD93_07115 [Ruminococcus sp.]|nr:hypothetical protein [Ruminococcus sp.]
MKEKFRQMMNSSKELDSFKEKQGERKQHSEKGVNAYTVFLAVVCVAIAVLGFVCRDLYFGFGFLLLALLLGLMAFFSYRFEKKKAENKNTKNEK